MGNSAGKLSRSSTTHNLLSRSVFVLLVAPNETTGVLRYAHKFLSDSIDSGPEQFCTLPDGMNEHPDDTCKKICSDSAVQDDLKQYFHKLTGDFQFGFNFVTKVKNGETGEKEVELGFLHGDLTQNGMVSYTIKANGPKAERLDHLGTRMFKVFVRLMCDDMALAKKQMISALVGNWYPNTRKGEGQKTNHDVFVTGVYEKINEANGSGNMLVTLDKHAKDEKLFKDIIQSAASATFTGKMASRVLNFGEPHLEDQLPDELDELKLAEAATEVDASIVMVTFKKPQEGVEMKKPQEGVEMKKPQEVVEGWTADPKKRSAFLKAVWKQGCNVTKCGNSNPDECKPDQIASCNLDQSQ